MADLDDLKAQLSFTADIGDADDGLLTRLLAAARNHVERLLGFTFAEATSEPPAEGFEDGVPPALDQAVLQLAAHWYENREAAGAGLAEVPFGVSEIVSGFRGWTF